MRCDRIALAIRYAVPTKRTVALPFRQIAPAIRPAIEPVLSRLDRHGELLEELKTALDIQFKRTAAIQAQLDHLINKLLKGQR